LLLLLLVALAVGVAGRLLERALPRPTPERLSTYVASRLAEVADRPEALVAEVGGVHEAIGLGLSVYGPDRRLLATSVEPPLQPADDGDRPGHGAPFRLVGSGFTRTTPLPGGKGLLVMSSPPRGDILTRLAVFIAVVLLVLALASIPLVHTISRPVERLTAAARALGAGDLTVRSGLRARGEVGELATAFDEMAARLERLVRGEKELIANVSHELRTPLARMRVALELAEEGDVARARQALGEIGEDVGELERLVAEILAAARLDLAGAGGLPLHLELLDPAALLGEVAQRFRSHHGDRTLDLEVAAGLPEVEADPALLRRLLGNLLDNAAKYSEVPSPITLAARPDGDALLLEVRDRGIGVAAEDLPRLFTPFFRTDRSRARGTGGVGLGLALAKRIAEAHGGTLSAAGRPEGGTDFLVRLPAASAA
jgi:two-component system OmpR family sensor kinase